MRNELLWMLFLILPLVNVTSRPVNENGDYAKKEESILFETTTSGGNLSGEEEVIAVSITSSVAVGRGKGKPEPPEPHDDLVAHESAPSTPVTVKPDTSNDTHPEKDIPPDLKGANVEFIKQLHSKKETRGTHLLEQIHPFQQQIRSYTANTNETLSDSRKETLDVKHNVKEIKHNIDETILFEHKIDDIHEEIENIPLGRSLALAPSSQNYIQGSSQRSERGQGPRLTTVSFNIVHDTPKTVTNYNDHSEPAERRFPDLQHVFSEPPQIYSEPAKVYSEPAKVYSEPAKVYSEPAKVYSEPAKIYSEPAKIYSEPAKFYSPAASLNLPPPQAPIPTPWRETATQTSIVTSVETTTTPTGQDVEHTESGHSAEESAPEASPEECREDKCKVGYVVEGRQYRKYRVEERTADGFIVGEFGVVRHEDGALRGVRYTADGAASPRLIHDALLKFLQL